MTMKSNMSKPDPALIAGKAEALQPVPAGDSVVPILSPAAALSLFRYGEASPYWDANIDEMRRKLLASGSVGTVPRMEFLVDAAREEIDRAMAACRRPCLQFSGGKDSLACLYLLRPYWGRLTVIWSSRSDAYPEARELFEDVRRKVHDVIEVGGDEQWRAASANTWPTDCVPARATWFGRMVEPTDDGFGLVNRYDCCLANFWQPMAAAVAAGGFDLVIRGQRDDEAKRAPFASGACDGDGRAYVLPIQHWTKRDVIAYLQAEGIEIPRQYGYGMASLDCLHCTAYLDENGGKLRYLRDFHPQAAVEYERRLRLIHGEQERHMRLTKIALGELDPLEGEGEGD
ncbi:phosphoadenosine phosphosulfate reductase family protein [Burkholderia thailandensis MSMB121]|uniref:phosphoadenosine phosphosulfate reductase domain-containing protein n=1 Tax=Burkholderia humptydooensis TaxID=430531 RepID=UPI00032803B9|nr:phosphoadenosine phosphosulfate reductase family protein [Burkholderia humptydooensis]AGK48329.1 phosphoadenosine phosphosulfate reductase family protein [Burkholderia thailandensis MSMB121]ATF37629.1 methyltransferase type 11 [Burkholderia thailandensis]KST75937.1 methyltransferase type 11 [Burkholderia humptydooensis]